MIGSDGSLFTDNGSSDGSSDGRSDGDLDDDGDENDDSDENGDAPAPDATEVMVVESRDPGAETGVPGIESDDDFCRARSEYAGSKTRRSTRRSSTSRRRSPTSATTVPPRRLSPATTRSRSRHIASRSHVCRHWSPPSGTPSRPIVRNEAGSDSKGGVGVESDGDADPLAITHGGGDRRIRRRAPGATTVGQ